MTLTRSPQGTANVENDPEGGAGPRADGLFLDAAAHHAAPLATPLRTPRRLALTGVPERVATPAHTLAAAHGELSSRHVGGKRQMLLHVRLLRRISSSCGNHLQTAALVVMPCRLPPICVQREDSKHRRKASASGRAVPQGLSGTSPSAARPRLPGWLRLRRRHR